MAFSGALSVARVVSVDVSVYGVQNAHGGLYGAHYVRLAGSVSNLLDPAALDGRGLGRRVGDLDLHADEAPAVAHDQIGKSRHHGRATMDLEGERTAGDTRATDRSEERRVGAERVSTCRSRG